MIIGASTACFYPMLTEDAVKTALSLGIKDLEIFINSPSELEYGYICSLKQMVDEYGGNVLAIHPYSSSIEPFFFFTNYERRFLDALDAYKRYYEAANVLGAKIFVLHGDRKPGKLSDELFCENYARMAASAKEYGICLAQENVNLFRSQDIDTLCRMRQLIGEDIRFVFDTKQAIRAGYDPYEFAQRLGSSIIHVHVSDSDDDNSCLLPGKGKMDFIRLRDIIERSGASPSWVVEVYRANYSAPCEIAQAVKLLKGTLENG